MSSKLSAEEWRMLSEACAFVGNSLLTPMTRTSAAGLDPAFWQAFPTFGDKEVAEAVQACEDFARRMQAEAAVHGEGVSDEGLSYGTQRCAVEFTKLFVGPPSPAAAPWETMYRRQDAKVGFGQATFEMRELLRQAGLELRNQNHQYEDHLGIELLYLSVLCRRMADGLQREGNGTSPQIAAASEPASADKAAIASFVAGHIAGWVPRFQQRIAEASPDGYFAPLVNLALCLARVAAR